MTATLFPQKPDRDRKSAEVAIGNYPLLEQGDVSLGFQPLPKEVPTFLVKCFVKHFLDGGNDGVLHKKLKDEVALCEAHVNPQADQLYQTTTKLTHGFGLLFLDYKAFRFLSESKFQLRCFNPSGIENKLPFEGKRAHVCLKGRNQFLLVIRFTGAPRLLIEYGTGRAYLESFIPTPEEDD
jgi:hypothetical protein